MARLLYVRICATPPRAENWSGHGRTGRTYSYGPASSFKQGTQFYMYHDKRMALKTVDTREACSKGGYSTKLSNNVIDRKWKPHGYVSLTVPGTLRAAELYDGGSHYEDCKVKCSSSGIEVQISYQDIRATNCTDSSVIFRKWRNCHGLLITLLEIRKVS